MVISVRHLLPKILIVLYVVCAVIYGVGKDWGRVIYWLGAAIIVTGTLMMK